MLPWKWVLVGDIGNMGTLMTHNRFLWPSPVLQPGLAQTLVCRCSGRNGRGEEGSSFKDTRIHWGDSEEGWVGIDEAGGGGGAFGRKSGSAVNDALRDVIAQAKESHYRYMGISTSADLDEIKAAYRRLSKEYHPDATALPLEMAAIKFMKLKEAYTVLSDETERRVYDWKLAQKVSKELVGADNWAVHDAAGNEAAGSRLPVARMQRYVEPVDSLAPGENLPLSEQAQSALLFDMFAALVSIATVIYVVFFKDPP